MKTWIFLLSFLLLSGNAFGQIEKEPIFAEKTSDYWVYVRLEDRSGVTPSDDAGRSKAGDVVAVLPVTPQHIPSETEKKEWMIYKTSLTETQRNEMLEPWVEETTTKDGDVQEVTKAYRKNKLDTSKLGVAVKKGLVAEKIDATKIETSAKTVDDLAKYEIKRKFYAYVQRPAIRLANIITRKAFAETISTINKTGEDYNTLTLWEDAVDGDLVTNTSQPTAECYDDDGDLNDNLTIVGSTTNSSYYMKITVPTAERHDGTAGSGFIIKPDLNENYESIIKIFDNYVVIEWVEFEMEGSAYWVEVRGIYISGSYTTIRNCIIWSADNWQNVSGIQKVVGANNKYYNNIIYGLADTTRGIRNIGADSVVYNNTVYDCNTNGILVENDATTTVKNNIAYNNGTDFNFGGADTVHDYNFSKDDTADGANSIQGDTDSKTPDFVSTTASSEDFHILSTSDAIDAGTDLSGTFTDDIDGVTRSGTWDIGADEYVSATPTARRFFLIQ